MVSLSKTGIYLNVGILLAILFPVGLAKGEMTSQRAAAEGISLLEAVKMTLKKQPAIHIQEQQVEISRGLLQEERGQFDPKVVTSISHERDNTPLTETQRIQLGGSKSSRTLGKAQLLKRRFLNSRGSTLCDNRP